MQTWKIWGAFAASLMVLLGVAGWLGLKVVQLESAQRANRYNRLVEETARLALWRMESAVVPLIAPESARRVHHYAALLPARRVHPHIAANDALAKVLLPSPLLSETPPFTLLHFQGEPDGQLSSPQLPPQSLREFAVDSGFTTAQRIATASRRLDRLRAILDAEGFLTAVLSPVASVGQADAPDAPDAPDYKARFKNVQQAQLMAQNRLDTRSTFDTNELDLWTDVDAGAMSARWVGDDLLLVRRVSVDGVDRIQGCWLDWPALHRRLLTEVHELLPEARLRKAPPAVSTGSPHRLAALPVNLVAGALPDQFQATQSASWVLRFALFGAGASVLLAAAACAALLVVIVRFSERRAAFVSAVTHELRTPLTTLQLYSDLLCEGRVTEETKRAKYLATIRREAGRLAHLVENVLAYSRLEAKSPEARLEILPLGALVERVSGRIRERVSQADMHLEVNGSEEAHNRQVRVDPSAVEQIVFNLVDNACKYARPANGSLQTIELDLELECGDDDGALLRVRDHGPGISKEQARVLFRPFAHGSATVDGDHKAGVGLGLALCRRLARGMHGDLMLDETTGNGATFVLRLPGA